MAHLQGKVDGPGWKGTWRQSPADRLFPTLVLYGYGVQPGERNGLGQQKGDRPPFGPSHLGEQNGDRQMRYEIRDRHQTSDSKMPPGARRYHGTGTCVIPSTMGTPWVRVRFGGETGLNCEGGDRRLIHHRGNHKDHKDHNPSQRIWGQHRTMESRRHGF